MVDADRLSAAYETARCDLLSECDSSGHWLGHLSGSALATATAVSALRLVERRGTPSGASTDSQHNDQVNNLVMLGLRWLSKRQNADGGWGDAEGAASNITSTMLVRAAFQLAAVPANPAGMMDRAEAFIALHGGPAGPWRNGQDKVFGAATMANCALAGSVTWRAVPTVPFEWAGLAPDFWKRLRVQAIGCALPTLMAVGLARFTHRKPWNPVLRILRARSIERSLTRIAADQSANGSFLHSVPITSFIVMSLASAGRAEHPIVRRGVEFLLATARSDGSWPIGSDQATRNTALAVNALATAGEDLRELHCLDWLLACQHRQADSRTGADSGGWALTGRSGGVANVADTSAVLLALAAWPKDDLQVSAERLRQAMIEGVDWILKLQDADGGWPTSCRGWGKLPLDRSGADLTAQALRAVHACRRNLFDAHLGRNPSSFESRITAASEAGLRFLARSQHGDGSWDPLWAGDSRYPRFPNRIVGTVAVLAAYRDLGLMANATARRGLDFLAAIQHPDGCFGHSVEETALVVELLLSAGCAAAHETAADRGLAWLIDSVEANRHLESSPIGLDSSKLMYCERLSPMALTVAALGRAVRRSSPRMAPRLTASLENA